MGPVMFAYEQYPCHRCKRLELLKASRSQTSAVAVACVLLLVGPHHGWIPALSVRVAIPAFFVGVLCAGLFFFSLVSAAYDFFQVHKWMAFYRQCRNEALHTERYIEQMTPKEREIIGYLLHHNQRLITAEQSGGHAAPLVSQRILVMALQPNQAFTYEDTPFVIQEHIWKSLMRHKDRFPYCAPSR
jgi:hypothetical protein